MKNSLKRTLILTVAIATCTLTACDLGASGATPTASGIDAVYTSAALTVTAQAGQPSATPSATDASQVTQTPEVTASDTALSFPTQSSLASSTPLPVNTCDNSAYISDVTYPDHTIVSPGQTFVKTWALLNSGTCTWSPTYKITFVSGNQMSGASTAIGKSIAPGQQANVSVSLVAPATTGEYTGYWRLANDQASKFGQSVYVLIDISNGTPATITGTPATATITLTPAPGNTRTSTPTAPPTSNDTATSTNPPPAPTNTQTPPAPTNTQTQPAPTITPTPTS